MNGGTKWTPMNSDTAWPSSFHGFIDYSVCFPPTPIAWLAIGLGITAGTVISLFPQWRLIFLRRSSFGLSTFTIFVTSFGQFIYIVNILCIHSAEFIGTLQYPFSIWIQRFLTFVNALLLWFCYLPILFMNMVFFDKEPRPVRQAESIKADGYFNHMMTILAPAVALLIIGIYVIGVFIHGYYAVYVVRMGEFLGMIVCALCVAQYTPQMVTTCRVKGPGSLSMALLAIQAPGGLINALFQALGQGDHWTTWSSVLAAAIQQFILIGICCFFKHTTKKVNESPSLSDASISAGLKMQEPLLAEGFGYK
jgi:hypothetical protein